MPAGYVARLRERFDAKWTPEPNTGCHIWSGALNSAGYGSIGTGARGHSKAIVRAAHRIGWLLEHGTCPEGLVLDHLCRNPTCVNPRHLEPVTVGENTRRGRVAREERAEHAALLTRIEAVYRRALRLKASLEVRPC